MLWAEGTLPNGGFQERRRVEGVTYDATAI